MTKTLPPALREARIRLAAEYRQGLRGVLLAAEYRQDEAMSPEQLCERAMAAALRWALLDCRDLWPEITAAIDALEQEATDAR